MTDEQHSIHPQRITIQLEIIPDDMHDPDAALVDAVGRDAVESLRKGGYTVQPVYTGQRGGPFFEVITFLTTFATDAWAQKDIILTDTSALVTIFSAVIPIAKHLLKAHEKRTSKDNTHEIPIKIVTEIDGMPISIEVPDLESADAAIRLAKRFQADHPTVGAKVTPQSNVKIMGYIPKNQRRRRR